MYQWSSLPLSDLRCLMGQCIYRKFLKALMKLEVNMDSKTLRCTAFVLRPARLSSLLLSRHLCDITTFVGFHHNVGLGEWSHDGQLVLWVNVSHGLVSICPMCPTSKSNHSTLDLPCQWSFARGLWQRTLEPCVKHFSSLLYTPSCTALKIPIFAWKRCVVSGWLHSVSAEGLGNMNETHNASYQTFPNRGCKLPG